MIILDLTYCKTGGSCPHARPFHIKDGGFVEVSGTDQATGAV